MTRPKILLVHLVAVVTLGLLTAATADEPTAATADEPTAATAAESAAIAPLAAQSLLLDGSAAGSRLVAVGERGHIVYSDDSGDTWQQAQVPTRALLTGVFFLDARLGWAVGHDAVILRTTDGGSSWQLQHAAPEEERPLLEIWFRSPGSGIAIGAYGYFLTTDDGGRTWSSGSVSEDDWHLNQLAISNTGVLCIAAEAGSIYRSRDNGLSWSALPSPYEGSFFGALWTGNSELIVFGLRGHLFRSVDDGDSWQAVETGTQAMLNDALILSDGRIVVVGLAGTILVSSDQGQTFSLLERSDRMHISTALPLGENRLILIGEGGVRTIDLDMGG